MSGNLVVNTAAMDKLASDVETRAANIEDIPHPDVTAVVRAFMPESALVEATASATSDLKGTLTVVSGQWESMASVVRSTRTAAEAQDGISATKFKQLGILPGTALP